MNNILINLIDGTNIRKAEESMSYQFETNARQFDILFEVSDIAKGYYPHTGITTREGICILYRRLGNSWYNLDLFYKETKITLDMSNYVDEGEIYEILIYGPIIAKLSKLQINISQDDILKVTKNKKNRNIVVAGGPISYGIGCTTTKSIFSNIIERKMEGYVHHITFNKFNYLEDLYDFYNNNPPVADITILELDYFSQKESVTENLLPEIIELIKHRSKYIIGWYVIPELKSFKKIIANNIIKEYIENGDITVIDLSYLYAQENFDQCAFNRYFVNDTGHILIYKELEKEIRRLTKWNI